MGKWIVLLALFPLALMLCIDQCAPPQFPVPLMRSVKELPRPTPSTAEIQISSFEFQQLFITNHPGATAIKGEPTTQTRFPVEVKLDGEEAIATAKFEAIDERGNVIQKILIERRAAPDGSSEFYGVMMVPNQPFRVVLSGKAIDGTNYSRTYERLFRPTTRPQSAIIIPPGPTGEDPKMRQELKSAVQEYMNKMEEELKEKAGEMIVMPRIRVFNVTYAPYLSKVGRPLGVRIDFDVEVSQDGYYNPELHVYPEYKNPDWRGRIQMKPLTGNIAPQPEEAGSPQSQAHILANGAGYIYRAGTTYHLTAEYVPDYIFQNEKKTKFCIWNQQYKYSPEMHSAWKAILASATPTKYTLYISVPNFGGEIEGLDPQGVLLENFVAEGAKDCGEQPTNRF